MVVCKIRFSRAMSYADAGEDKIAAAAEKVHCSLVFRRGLVFVLTSTRVEETHNDSARKEDKEPNAIEEYRFQLLNNRARTHTHYGRVCLMYVTTT